MSLATIKNGFRKTGICPFNPEAINKTKLTPIDDNITPSPSLTPPIPTTTLPGAANMEPTPIEDLEKSTSEHDFTIHSLEETPLATSTENTQTKMNIVPQYLDNIFYFPSGKRSKNSHNPRVITEGRTITDKAHQKLYKEKLKIKARKEKEKEERKRAREKKQETKLLGGENKNLRKRQGRKKERE